MTNEFDAPLLDEVRANAILDDIVPSTLQVQNEDGAEPVDVNASAILKAVFGDVAPLVAHLIFQGMTAGHYVGLLDSTTPSDRTDLLVAALRKVHTPEQFGDCVEDGDHYPCKTARVLNLVAGGDPHVSGVEDIEKFANGETSA